MSDNISRRIEQMVEKFCDDYCGSVDCANCGVSAETVTEFLKAERTGHWITDKYGNILCSECGWCAPQIMTGCLADRHLDYAKSNFCWHCGADMRGENNERK